MENEINQEVVKERLQKMGISFTKCRNCEREIFFMETKNRKLIPVTFELVCHFSDCPAADKFRKTK